ncbi:N amino acid transport system protein [Fusarium oxysporum f. sp. albedinis]|nr:N amino acid transport system protein [Fusarium oxysporum f. sp. albedinis]
MLSCIRQKAIPIGVLLHRKLVLPRSVSKCALEFGFKLIASHCQGASLLQALTSTRNSLRGYALNRPRFDSSPVLSGSERARAVARGRCFTDGFARNKTGQECTAKETPPVAIDAMPKSGLFVPSKLRLNWLGIEEAGGTGPSESLNNPRIASCIRLRHGLRLCRYDERRIGCCRVFTITILGYSIMFGSSFHYVALHLSPLWGIIPTVVFRYDESRSRSGSRSDIFYL